MQATGIADMATLIPVCLIAMLAGNALVVGALAFIGWLCWVRVRDQREYNSPEAQRERLRRAYWGQAKT
jgi:hypothetical protein